VFGSKRLQDRFDAVEIASWPKVTSTAALVLVAFATDRALPGTAALLVLVAFTLSH
jgi:uncharacterized protein (UPF0261 family)